MARHNHKVKKHTPNDNDRQVQAADPSYDKKTRTYAVIPPDEKVVLMPDRHPTEPCIKINKSNPHRGSN